MSNCLKKMKKNIDGIKLEFPIEMYNTLPGSLIVCCLMFTPFDERPENKKIIKTWKYLYKHLEKYPSFDDPEFINKTLKLYELDKPDVFPIAMVQSQYNCLFAPFIDGKILPLREDGFMGVTLLKGKVYPIDWEEKEE